MTSQRFESLTASCFWYAGARNEVVASKGKSWHVNCRYDLYSKSFRQYWGDKIHHLKENSPHKSQKYF